MYGFAVSWTNFTSLLASFIVDSDTCDVFLGTITPWFWSIFPTSVVDWTILSTLAFVSSNKDKSLSCLLTWILTFSFTGSTLLESPENTFWDNYVTSSNSSDGLYLGGWVSGSAVPGKILHPSYSIFLVYV